MKITIFIYLYKYGNILGFPELIRQFKITSFSKFLPQLSWSQIAGFRHIGPNKPELVFGIVTMDKTTCKAFPSYILKARQTFADLR